MGGAKDDAHGKWTLLVVDDEWLISASISDYFREAGFIVLEAQSAEGAIQRLKGNHVDAVVSDIKMPGTMSGIGLAKWIREKLPAVAVVIMSGGTHAADVVEALGSATPFFTKPFNYARLESCIREQLRAV